MFESLTARRVPRATHWCAALLALLVTFLWSTSWVLIKIGLGDIPPLIFAGLRYSLACLCLLPFLGEPGRLATLRRLSRRGWLRLAMLGLLYYTVTQGAQFVGLYYLPAISASLILSFSPIAVALLGIPLLSERPSALQWAGTALSLAGILLYFYPNLVPAGQAVGLAVILAGMLANALSAILGRAVNRGGAVDALAVTAVSMGIGGLVLLVAGTATQGLPRLSALNWAIIGWLAVVNTALAFTLWNHTLRTLSAMESSIINNSMLVQVAVLAWLFLDEPINLQKTAGLAMVAAGTLLVQLKRSRA